MTRSSAFPTDGPSAQAGPTALYEDRYEGAAVRFFGRGLPRPAAAAAEHLVPPGIELGWVEQIHSGEALEGSQGCAGKGDGLFTRRAGLALAIVTADCVPVLLARRGEVAAAHAGWRGIVAGVVPATIEQMGEVPQVAWVGPAIGAHSYEVGPEVAGQIARATTDSAVIEIPGRRPHANLAVAVEHQLRSAGVEEIRHVDLCTFTDDRLWSYRRHGAEAGRNYSVIWRQ